MKNYQRRPNTGTGKRGSRLLVSISMVCLKLSIIFFKKRSPNWERGAITKSQAKSRDNYASRTINKFDPRAPCGLNWPQTSWELGKFNSRWWLSLPYSTPGGKRSTSQATSHLILIRPLWGCYLGFTGEKHWGPRLNNSPKCIPLLDGGTEIWTQFDPQSLSSSMPKSHQTLGKELSDRRGTEPRTKTRIPKQTHRERQMVGLSAGAMRGD